MLVPVVPVASVAPAEHHAQLMSPLCRRLLLPAAQATLMMTLCQPTPPRVKTLDVLVPMVPAVHVAPAEHPVDVTVSWAAALLDDDAMPANATSRDDAG
jgi:hypothetical protein